VMRARRIPRCRCSKHHELSAGLLPRNPRTRPHDLPDGVDQQSEKDFVARCDSLPPVGLNRIPGANLRGITSFFLRAKHWQIFILVFGVYFVGQMALVGSILTSPHSQEVFSKGGLLAGLVMTLSTLGLFVWL
jgi:hypothetical protein